MYLFADKYDRQLRDELRDLANFIELEKAIKTEHRSQSRGVSDLKGFSFQKIVFTRKWR